MDFLAALLEYRYLQRALVTAVVVGVLCGVVGSFTLLRGLALMGDAISHAVLPGIAASFMLGVSVFPGALVAGLLAAFGIGFVSQNSRIKSDAAIGIVFSAMFALGVVMVSLSPSSTDLTKILFGNVLAVRPADMWLTIGVAAAVLAIIVLLFKELQVSTFDPTMAAAYGLPVKRLHYLLMAMLTVATVTALQTVGVVLVVAMLVIPAATAYLLTERLGRMVVISGLLGGVASVAGLYFSFEHNLPSGAVIVLCSAVLFAIVFLAAPRHGFVAKWTAGRRARAAGPSSLELPLPQ
ncbi:metal ABC transporter permease [Tomitella biformata]|uniref:metal ABC transporter permease n=1 Tax=Tomitella biformata TaxID=630403 RepID=UPI000463D820|nr:metal ABC transporter permease [Tomitella biformata]